MDGLRFDTLTKHLAVPGTRRRLLGGLVAGALGLVGHERAEAAICRAPGRVCREGANCCSTRCNPSDASGRRRCGCRTVDDCPAAPVCRMVACQAGVCVTTITPDVACDDGNPCTADTACTAAGRCVGTPVVCPAQDDCHQAACDRATGQCLQRPLTGTPCDDGNACTQTDTCQGGVCVGSNPVVCLPLSQCHVAGPCNTGTGRCSNPPKASGVPCNDGNHCTQTDRCDGAGNCVGSDPVDCAATACRAAGTCDPATGQCSGTLEAPGTPCGTAASCGGGMQHAQDTCDGSGACVPGTDTSCGLYVCGGSACLTSCARDEDCVGAAHCDGGVCVGDRANGEACDEASDCQSGICNAESDFCCSQDCAVGVACSGANFTCAAACVPNCAGKNCGDDGCAGHCGICGPHQTCSGGTCVASCGWLFEPCCAGGACNHAELTCDQNNQCAQCGRHGLMCCAGDVCSSGRICNNGTCEGPCGVTGQDCCAGNTCNDGFKCVFGSCHECGHAGQFCCDEEPRCRSDQACFPNGFCQVCGGRNELCCPGGHCFGEFICNSSSRCQLPCGARGDACCSDGSCEAASHCEGGICV